MYTKSIMQQTAEMIKVKNNFKAAIENLMEKYNIEDSVFIFNKGTLCEATEGYFTVTKEYDNLMTAVSESNINDPIRVINNTIFQTGNIYSTLTECKDADKVFDLNRLETIR